MTPDQFRAELTALNLTQRAAAKALGINERTARRYATQGVSETAAMRVRLHLQALRAAKTLS